MRLREGDMFPMNVGGGNLGTLRESYLGHSIEDIRLVWEELRVSVAIGRGNLKNVNLNNSETAWVKLEWRQQSCWRGCIINPSVNWWKWTWRPLHTFLDKINKSYRLHVWFICLFCREKFYQSTGSKEAMLLLVEAVLSWLGYRVSKQ